MLNIRYLVKIVFVLVVFQFGYSAEAKKTDESAPSNPPKEEPKNEKLGEQAEKKSQAPKEKPKKELLESFIDLNYLYGLGFGFYKSSSSEENARIGKPYVLNGQLERLIKRFVHPDYPHISIISFSYELALEAYFLEVEKIEKKEHLKIRKKRFGDAGKLIRSQILPTGMIVEALIMEDDKFTEGVVIAYPLHTPIWLQRKLEQFIETAKWAKKPL